jgi:exodeoxyribonuclease VII large subunit
VQGPRAAAAVVEALRALCELPELDVIVVARGGGSFEDLLPFSDERLVRAIAGCPVPVVSAVGHEQDTPLCDLAADVRASTPTAAGRLVVPDLHELQESLDRSRAGLERGTRRMLERERERLSRARERLRREPGVALERGRARLELAEERLGRAPALLLERRRAGLEQTSGRLQALSPRATLQRGYAIVRAGDAIVRAAAAVSPGDELRVDVADGAFGARVE